MSHSPNYSSSKEAGNSAIHSLDEQYEDQKMLLGEDSDGPPSDIDESTRGIRSPENTESERISLSYER